MTQLKRNLLANYLGQGWVAVMGLAFLPVYIQYLGMESFALIGVFSVMQAWLGLLDMGMSPTLTREMARFTAGAHSPHSIRNLLRSLECFCIGIAALIVFVVWIASGYLARDWLKAEQLSTTVVAHSLSVMGLVVALRFAEGIYRSSLFGLQEQVWYNAANAILSTLRWGGSVAVLAWVSPSIGAFFFWQAFVSLVSLASYSTKVHRSLPTTNLPVRFSFDAIADVWKFTAGMIGITLFAILLTQVDKIVLSRLLTLESFGYYTLTASLAGALYTLIGPAVGAVYPRMVELATRDDREALASVYHLGAQLVTILTAPAAMLLSIFSEGFVFAWSGNLDVAKNTAPILSAMVLGTFLNVLMWMPYQCQIAHGWTSLALKINLVGVIILVPANFFVVPYYGAVGAAWVWVAVNATYVLISIHLMHRRLIPTEKWSWYLADVLLPIVGALVVMLVANTLRPLTFQDRWRWLAFLLITTALSLVASATMASRIRPHLLAILQHGVYWLYLKVAVV